MGSRRDWSLTPACSDVYTEMCAGVGDQHRPTAAGRYAIMQRLYTLDAWRETPFYAERAALAWTETLTLISQEHAPGDVYDLARAHASEKERAGLSRAMIIINGWNRLAIGFRAFPGVYQPASHKA